MLGIRHHITFLISLHKVSRAMAELVYGELVYKKMLKSLIRVIFVVSSLFFTATKVRGESLTDKVCDPIRSRLVISIIDKVTVQLMSRL